MNKNIEKALVYVRGLNGKKGEDMIKSLISELENLLRIVKIHSKK